MKRRQPTNAQKLACTMLLVPDLVPVHLRERAEDEIIGAFEWHHWRLPVAQGGTNEPQNLMPMLKELHAAETRTKTVPMVAKSKRIIRKNKKHEDAMRKKYLGGTLIIDDAASDIHAAYDVVSSVEVDVGKVENGRVRHTRKIVSRGFQGSRKFNGQVTFKRSK